MLRPNNCAEKTPVHFIRTIPCTSACSSISQAPRYRARRFSTPFLESAQRAAVDRRREGSRAIPAVGPRYRRERRVRDPHRPQGELQCEGARQRIDLIVVRTERKTA
ncbi:hypothetical protein BYI23_B010730 [Burkholderia sp. YI23]|nr:hypothetical protein BYI23_B010730 [Burkholderia sp. YI23]